MQFLSRPDFYFNGKKAVIMGFGINQLSMIDNLTNRLMLNMSYVDRDRVSLNNKKNVLTISPSSNCKEDLLEGNDGFDTLREKIVFSSKANEKLLIDSISLDTLSSVDTSKPVTVMIPSVCQKGQICYIRVNDEERIIPSYSAVPAYHNLVFNIPPGTNTIKIEAYGLKPNSVFAIHNIQLWQ